MTDNGCLFIDWFFESHKQRELHM